jgi:ATP-dependent Lon protease
MIDTTFGWGKIINRELLSDGRSNILLQGIGLATIVSYESTEPFIIASVEKKEMERAPSDSLEYKILLKEILTLTKSYLIQIKADWEFIQEIDKLYFTNSPVDIIASLIHFNVEKKRELLLTMDELEKARKLLSALQELGN